MKRMLAVSPKLCNCSYLRGNQVYHMQRGELPWENGNSHEARDLFAARATHFENAAVDCFGQLIPAMNPAITPAAVAGIGPFFGPFWPDSHQTEGGRAHIGCRSEVE